MKILLVAFVCSVAPCSAQDPPPLVNRSFEDVEDGAPTGWRVHRWGGRGAARLAEFGRTGERCAELSSTGGADISWGTTVPVRPFSRYRLRGFVKTEDLAATTGRGVLFNLHGRSGDESAAVTGTQDWTELSFEFDTGATDSVQLNCLFGGWGLATGTAWFDDLELELLSARELSPSVVIDASSPREPIHPFLYGQFIEHMGRCIYGGIWAEMLEDRKFWFAPGAEGSPWTVLGDPGVLTIDRETPYVGQQTPVVASGAELAQGGLGLVGGERYEGRVVVAADSPDVTVAVSLVWGPRPEQRQTIRLDDLVPDFRKLPIAFVAGASTDDGRLEIGIEGRGAASIGTVSLMPADHVEGFRADVLALLRELDSPIYRWPGGNFVSGYDWRDGIGDPDRRPPRKNPAWQGIESNDVGIHEFMRLCELIDAEPYVTVNTGLGSVEECAAEVDYCNGAADTELGALRAKHGHPEPFGVRWWAVGNEMYGDWQLGHMPLADYVQKHRRAVEAMRAADPSIAVVGVGAVGRWSETMLRECAGHMDLISEHFYCQERPGLLAHAAWPAEQVRRIADAHRGYRRRLEALEGRDIRIALDEWNYWYGPHVYGELGTRYFLKDALGVARGLHELFRNSDIYCMASYAQTVNVIGAIKTTATEAAFDTTGLVLTMYRRHYGSVPVHVGGTPEPLDVAAAWNDARDLLTIAVVNPTGEAISLALQVAGAEPSGEIRRWTLTGPHDRAYNEPGGRTDVRIEESRLDALGDALAVPARSVTLHELRVRR